MSDDIKTCRHRVCTVEINGECMCTAEKYQAILAEQSEHREREHNLILEMKDEISALKQTNNDLRQKPSNHKGLLDD